MPRRIRKVCCCCWDKDEDSMSDWSDSDSDSSYESVEDLPWSPGSRRLPTYSTPKPSTAQEWDSLFFTPEMLAPPFEPPNAPPNGGQVPVESPQADVGTLRAQNSMAYFESLQMTKSLRANVLAMPPDAPVSTPTMNTQLRGVSVGDMRKAMRMEPFWYCRFLKKSRKCYDIKKYRWTASDSTGLARGVRSRLPLPTELPGWLTRSFKVPEETAFTTVVRISGAGRNPENMDDLAEIPDSQPVVLVMQSCSHDAPYGEYFRIQETLIFARSVSGTDLKRWVSVLWVKSLPWTASPLKNIIESQTVADSQKAHDDLVKFLIQAAEDAREA
mmetsp:Transcript_19652/g.43400  ORF Transcript_19652/g.43400 Transcript_19652/m.43400 type:complete len:329 (+) Transcript_19652:56-1042(+)